MIPANELRIGNFVKHRKNSSDNYKLYRVARIEVSKKGAAILKLENGSDFYRMSHDEDGDLQPALFVQDASTAWERKEIITSAHDYQNLFFAINGKEADTNFILNHTQI